MTTTNDVVDWRLGASLYERSRKFVLDQAAGRSVHLLELDAKKEVGSKRSIPKPTFLFVHGSMASMAQFFPAAAALNMGLKDAPSSSSGFGVVAYDWLGCGRSPKPQDWDAYAWSALYRDLEAIYERTVSRVSGKIVVVAHSYGTHLAMRLALAQIDKSKGAPSGCDKFGGLVLLGGSLATLNGGLPLFRLPVFVLDYIQPWLTSAFIRSAFEETSPPELLASQEASSNANAMHVCKAYYRQVQGLSEVDIHRLGNSVVSSNSSSSNSSEGAPESMAEHRPAIPVWLMHGNSDAVLPIAGAESLHSAIGPAAQGNIRVVQGGSHNFIIERPAELVELLLEVAAAVERGS